MPRTLRIVSSPSIPANPPPSPYVTLHGTALRLSHAIRASGVRIAGLGTVTTRAQLALAKAEAAGLADLAAWWLVEIAKAEGQSDD